MSYSRKCGKNKTKGRKNLTAAKFKINEPLFLAHSTIWVRRITKTKIWKKWLQI